MFVANGIIKAMSLSARIILESAAEWICTSEPLPTVGKLQYLIQLRDSYISGIESLEEAISIAEEVIEENKLFIE